MMFPDAYIKVLMRVDFFDHHPILINFREDHYDWFDKPFRLENAWLSNDSYSNMLKEVLREGTDVVGNLNNVVIGIDKGKLDSFDKIKRTKNYIMRRLEGIQRRLKMHDSI